MDKVPLALTGSKSNKIVDKITGEVIQQENRLIAYILSVPTLKSVVYSENTTDNTTQNFTVNAGNNTCKLVSETWRE